MSEKDNDDSQTRDQADQLEGVVARLRQISTTPIIVPAVKPVIELSGQPKRARRPRVVVKTPVPTSSAVSNPLPEELRLRIFNWMLDELYGGDMHAAYRNYIMHRVAKVAAKDVTLGDLLEQAGSQEWLDRLRNLKLTDLVAAVLHPDKYALPNDKD